MVMFHVVFTVVLLLIFIGIVIWAFGPKRKAYFEEAAQLPFADESAPQSVNSSDAKNGEKA